MPNRNLILRSKTIDDEANLDQNTHIEMVIKILSKDFGGFKATYNLGNNNLTLTQLIKELQSYELILNGSQQIQKVEANLTVASSSKGKGKHAKRNNGKSSGPQKVEKKRTNRPKDLSKPKCFFCNKKGHFKANCKEWNDYLTNKEKFMVLFCIIVLLFLVDVISVYFPQDLTSKGIFGNTKMVAPIDAPNTD
ncbi:hypothetical protein PVK06_019532 [Gossypium arboreum]|uniref:CCHC-type domain-containing protein n=1 Tax=Gossypium arboreum TaxID=29729 RepID=A0ABR0PK36_GOSAR|nr:hypothetical protein PVK06_019532 [Gossypium arboreum]